MQKTLIAVVATAALFAAPAFAESNPGNTSSGDTSAASSHTYASGNLAQIREKITNDLTQDGFKDINVVADSFLVHAVNKQGEPVVMIINPNSVFSVTTIGSNTMPENQGSKTASK